MDQESVVIESQMEHTRGELTEKLQLLENRVSKTVTNAAETVESVRSTVQATVNGAAETISSIKLAMQDTVDSVRDSVQDAADSVRQTLDLRRQVKRQPWTMIAGATAVGFGVGVIVTRIEAPKKSRVPLRGSGRSQANDRSENCPSNRHDSSDGLAVPSSASPQLIGEQNERYSSPNSFVENPWTPAVNRLKGLAIGVMFGLLREVLSKSMPDAFNGQIGEVIDNATTSLGGERISGRILPSGWGEELMRTATSDATSKPLSYANDDK